MDKATEELWKMLSDYYDELSWDYPTIAKKDFQKKVLAKVEENGGMIYATDVAKIATGNPFWVRPFPYDFFDDL